MAEKIYKTEMVDQGNKANWPNQSDYVEPTRKGYLFNGWDYDWKNKVITEDTDIHPIWDKYTVIADANRTLISGEGDNNTDPTKMFYYLRTDSGNVIPDDVTFEKVALSSDELEIQFTDNGTTKEDNKNVKKIIIKENDVNKDRYYRFKAKYSKDGGVYSDVCELRQVGKEQIILPPFDYLTFTYSWTGNDGKDLDSATVIRNSGIPIESDTTLDDYYVGYGGNGNKDSVNKYLIYGGDNMQSGDEGALVKWKDVLATKDYVSEGITTLYLDIYANWYNRRKNGNMSITFNTYKGNDGMVKDGFVFKPTGDTVLVSTKTINNLNAYASHSNNVFHPRNVMAKVYSKMATVEYDIRSKTALLIGNYTRSGRQLEYKGAFDGKNYGITSYRLPNFDKNSHQGTVKVSKMQQLYNETTTYLNWDINTVTLEKKFYDGATDDDLTCGLLSDRDGGLILNYSMPPNNRTTGKARNVDVKISMPYDNAMYEQPYVLINFYQNEN